MNEHSTRMDAFWADLRKVQLQIERTKRMLADINEEARVIEASVKAQRKLDRQAAQTHRWLRDEDRPPGDGGTR